VLSYGTHSQGILQFYLHTPCSSADGMNHTCLWRSSRSWFNVFCLCFCKFLMFYLICSIVWLWSLSAVEVSLFCI